MFKSLDSIASVVGIFMYLTISKFKQVLRSRKGLTCNYHIRINKNNLSVHACTFFRYRHNELHTMVSVHLNVKKLWIHFKTFYWKCNFMYIVEVEPWLYCSILFDLLSELACSLTSITTWGDFISIRLSTWVSCVYHMQLYGMVKLLWANTISIR